MKLAHFWGGGLEKENYGRGFKKIINQHRPLKLSSHDALGSVT